MKILAFVVMLLPPLIALWDILKSDFNKKTDKYIWLVVVVLLLPIGAFAYYLFGTQMKSTS